MFSALPKIIRDASSAILVLAGPGIAALVHKKFFSKQSNKLAILGMKMSGKTTMLNKMRGIKELPQSTNSEPYDKFTYTTKSNKAIKIEKGKDIGGTQSFISLYDQIIKDNEFIFFFFDVNLYLNNIDYLRDCNSRLEFISKRISKKKFAIIATHPDIINLKEHEIREKVRDLIKDKKYSSFFSENFYVLNLLNDDEFQETIDKLFR